MKYPKINSLFRRDRKTKKIIEGDYSCPEFDNIEKWLVTEKIDGMNIRIFYKKGSKPRFGGRTDNAQLPPKLLDYLQEHFTTERLDGVLGKSDEAILYGEGYGEKIQRGGYYSKEQRFVLFDILVESKCWLEWDSIEEIAEGLEIPHAPLIHNAFRKQDVIDMVKDGNPSYFAEEDHVFEGVVARAYPMMLFRDGTPMKFKLKVKDFK